MLTKTNICPVYKHFLKEALDTKAFQNFINMRQRQVRCSGSERALGQTSFRSPLKQARYKPHRICDFRKTGEMTDVIPKSTERAGADPARKVRGGEFQ